MTDEELTGTWTTLEPTATQHRRIEARVFTWLDAHDTSLAAEWLGLFRIAPLGALSLATVGAIATIAVSPIPWFVRTLAAALM